MKQMDTIRNHEWIPTEFDLENMPRVTQLLPTATAENFGIVYLLDGPQDGYVKSHFYKCAKDEETGLYYWMDLHVGRFSVGNCKNIRISIYDDGAQLRVIMAWEDPDDVIVGSEITHWKKTVLVHKVGSMPLTVNDGTVLCTCETRNAYAAFGSFSTTISDNRASKHYFKLFPYSDDDAITNDDQNGRVAGYNYVITSDAHPYTLDSDGNPVYRDYYSRTLDTETGLYTYTLVDPNDSSKWTISESGFREFKKGVPYYSYQNCLLNWAGIKELVKNGIAEDYFPCGTILTLPYHGDYGDMAFEVVDFDNVEPYDTSVKFTMTLQAKYLYSWWDHSGIGYVFDTNEKAGAATMDSVRDMSKVYFLCHELDSTETAEPAASINTHQPGRYIFLESVWDANRGDAQKGSASAHTWGVDGLSWSSWKQSGKYECELPYTCPYRGPFNDRTRLVPGGSTLAYAGNVICSDLRRKKGLTSASADYIQTSDVVYQPNKAYFSDTNGTAKTFTVGEPITGTVYEWSSKIFHSHVLYTASTGTNKYYNKTGGTNTDFAYVNADAVVGGFGAKVRKTVASCLDGGTMNLGSQLPRANSLADRFHRVFKVKNNADSYGTVYDYDLKYFLPVETLISKHIVKDTASANANYAVEYLVYLRDCSDDLRTIYARIYNNVVGTEHDALAPYVLGTYASGGQWRMNLAKVCGYDPNGNSSTTPQPLLKMPTQDEFFIKGKIYWMAVWSACSGSASYSDWYYERLGGGSNESVAGDFSNPYIYRRVRVEHNDSVNGLYKPTWMKLDFATQDEVTVEGVTYRVGELIPIRAGHGYCTYQLDASGNDSTTKTIKLTSDTTFTVNKVYYRKPSNDATYYVPFVTSTANQTVPSNTYYEVDASGTSATVKNDLVWTMGNKTSGGLYVEMTKDWNGATPKTTADKGSSYSPSGSNGTAAGTVYNGCFRTTDFFEGPMQKFTNAAGSSVSRIWLFNKMPNFERVAYGNHVWCQSNVRCYLNGPFDTSKEYVETADESFVTSRAYYRYVYGTGYVRLVQAARLASGSFETGKNYYYIDGSHNLVKRTSEAWANDKYYQVDNPANYSFVGLPIANWKRDYNSNQPAYIKLDGGVPVGVKLDINQPSKNWDYGCSPVMQYKNVNGRWVPAYTEGDQWWTEQLSVNNGLKYDKLASMYYNIYVGKGTDGDSVDAKTPLLVGSFRNKTPYNNETLVNETSSAWVNNIAVVTGKINGTGNPVTITTRQRTVRQSFLHGFIDCQYRRSTDTTPVSGKTYFMRDIYGRYKEVTDIGTSSPYGCGLYEPNPNFKTDIQDAYDFLNAIVPVVNRNGLYGTTGAYDFYPRSGTSGVNLGGTVCVDKVWLMSTNQIVGGEGVNNGVYEEWSGAGNGRWATFGVADENRYGFSVQTGHKYGLKKWAICNKNWLVFGATSLNDSRIKYSLTLGQHTANGYSDSGTAAQYWWLRSAGGGWTNDVFCCVTRIIKGNFEDPKYACTCITGFMDAWSIPAHWNTTTVKIWLSPLITIG